MFDNTCFDPKKRGEEREEQKGKEKENVKQDSSPLCGPRQVESSYEKVSDE